MIALWASAALMVVTAIAHSTLSETHLLKPMRPASEASAGTRMHFIIVRYALHAMSMFMILSAVSVIYPATPRSLIMIIGVGWTLLGLVGLAVSRGAHRGWPVIAGAGICALMGAA